MMALCLGEPRAVVGPAADCPRRGRAPRLWSFFLSQTQEQQGLFFLYRERTGRTVQQQP